MKVVFRGGEAEHNVVDLYAGSESLSGIGRAAALVAHYIVTGEVRFRAPYSDGLEYRLSGFEEGSFGAIISAISNLPDNVQAAAAKVRASKLLQRVLERAVGHADYEVLDLGEVIVPPGDIDILTEAATPALKKVHRWIDSNGKSISVTPDGRRGIRFDRESREYLENEDVDVAETVQDVSVGALNVNSRNGRVFFHDIGRTVPFFVPRNATNRTVTTLSQYLTEYAERTGATVNIRFRRVRYPDGRLKRIIISDCYPIAGQA